MDDYNIRSPLNNIIKNRLWRVTAQAEIEGRGEQTVTTFVRANTKRNAEKAGRRSILHMPDVYLVGPVTAKDCSHGPDVDSRFA